MEVTGDLNRKGLDHTVEVEASVGSYRSVGIGDNEYKPCV